MSRRRFLTAWVAAAIASTVFPGVGGGAGTAARADTIELTGVLRDFKRGDQAGGHPDFETAGRRGRFGHAIGMTTMQLGADKRPVYNPTRPALDTMTSAVGLAQWYHDVPGVNVAVPHTIVLSNGASGPGGVYTYRSDAFFPVDGRLLGNQGLAHNYHFTYELHTQFTYKPGQKFTFVGDDDVWVYINGKKVLDLGGVRRAITGTVVLLDGKAFIVSQGNDAETQIPFPLGNGVVNVSSSTATAMAARWTALGLAGSCPIKSGQRYIDLGLGQPGDVACTFTGNRVAVQATHGLGAVVLAFTDGSQQLFDGLGGASGTFTPAEGYAEKTLAGCYVRTTGASGFGPMFTVNGGGGSPCTLDFFFAERHTVESTFRIDTSIVLRSVATGTGAPAFD